MWHIRLFATTVALSVLCGACTSGSAEVAEPINSEVAPTSEPTAPTTSPTTASTTTTEPPTTEPPAPDFPEPEDGEIFDEYIAKRLERFREIVREAAENPTLTPAEDFPEIADYADGPMLQANHEYLRVFATDGVAIREPAQSAVGRSMDEKTRVSGVVEVSGDQVTLFECSVDDVDLVNAQTGEILLSGVLTELAVTTMQRFDSGWKAVDGEVTQTLEGVDGCFLASEAEFPY